MNQKAIWVHHHSAVASEILAPTSNRNSRLRHSSGDQWFRANQVFQTLIFPKSSKKKNEPFVIPLYALIAAPAAGLVIGMVAGLYPAAKAARLSPTEALRV